MASCESSIYRHRHFASPIFRDGLMKTYFRRWLAFFSFFSAFLLCWSNPAQADDDRFSAGGYFRIAARPDFQGGKSQLGLWNISGRLLNETTWAALEMRLQLLKASPGTNEVWTSLHAKVEGGSAHGADLLNGSLGDFALTQLYAKAGNVLIKDVVWQVGTLDYYFGDLGLYDMKFAEIFYETIGVSASWSNPYADVLVGIGDSGYLKKSEGYNTIITIGAATRIRPSEHFEFGLGAEFFYEPSVTGSENGPHQTKFDANSGVQYENFARKNVLETYAHQFGTDADMTKFESAYPHPSEADAFSFKVVGYLGFGKLGPLKWNNLFFNFLREHPESYYYETYKNVKKRIYIKEWTDERYQFNIGDEMNFELVKDRFDLTIAGLFGYHFDKDDDVSASEKNRLIGSVVARGQVYITPTVHFLAETSYAQENSLNGNLWRKSPRSVRESNNGIANSMGLEYGDLDSRKTWQGKLGFVLNPGGTGIFARPSLRLLYGVQYSNAHNAFPNSNTESLDLTNEFFGQDTLKKLDECHWHHVISIEAEAWF